MAKRDPKDGDTVIIKKYANRRLYNTSSSSYITLDDLSKMTRDGTDFKVLDAKSGDDITHSILTQIKRRAYAAGQLPARSDWNVWQFHAINDAALP
jgi:polyhydroxyalkanoate synthesis repressor PhaR